MFKIISILSLVASACAGGLEHLVSPGVVTLGGHSVVHSSRLLAPAHYSQVVPHSFAHQHVTVARPSAVAVERVSVGSVPHLSVVNEPTTIVTPGKPIRGHSYTSEVRHDTVARLHAPVFAYPSPAVHLEAPAYAIENAGHLARVVEEPIVSEVVETRSPALAHYTSDVVYPSHLRTVVSAPQVYATGAAQVVAGPAAVKGYTSETVRTDLVNEVRHRTAHIPTTIYQDSVVESVPTVLSHQPYLTKSVFGSPLLSTLIKK